MVYREGHYGIEPDHRQGRLTKRDMGTTKWWRKHSSDRTFPKLDNSPANNEPISPRALIDAYLSDRGYNKSNWQDRPKALIEACGQDPIGQGVTAALMDCLTGGIVN